MCWCRADAHTPCCGARACHLAAGLDPKVPCPFCKAAKARAALVGDSAAREPGTADGSDRFG